MHSRRDGQGTPNRFRRTLRSSSRHEGHAVDSPCRFRQLEAPRERLVDVLALVCREDHRPGVALHALTAEVDLEIGVPVIAVADLGPSAEQRIRLVEEEDRVLVVGIVKGRERFFSVSPMCF
jgi:hypothetical protein